MKDRLHWHLLVAFGLALGIYLAAFSCDHRVRTRKGPWEVEFFATTNGEPAIRVNQAALAIANVQVTFAGERMTNPPATIVFARPGPKQLPFGTLKFEDLTYLPGSVTFDFYGHEVELLPRTLYLNKQEHAWQPGAAFRLKPEEKLPPEAFSDEREKKTRRNRAADQTATNSPPANAR